MHRYSNICDKERNSIALDIETEIRDANVKEVVCTRFVKGLRPFERRFKVDRNVFITAYSVVSFIIPWNEGDYQVDTTNGTVIMDNETVLIYRYII